VLSRVSRGATEGDPSRGLAARGRKEPCADVARTIDLGPVMRLGNSEIQAGGHRRTAILADVCEALIGAVFVDGGYAPAAALIERYWQGRLRKTPPPLRAPH